MSRFTWICLAVIGPLFSTGPAKPIFSQQPPAGLDETLQNERSAFLVQAELNHRTADYRQGDQLFLRVASEADAWVYVLFEQADGKVFQIFPNAFQRHNRLQAGQAVQIPSRDDQFRWTIGPPYGREVVKVIAAREEVKGLSLPQLRQGRFNPVERQTLKAVELELDEEEPARWSEFDLPLHTYARDEQVQPALARRFGLFIGVAEHQFHAEQEAIDGRGTNVKTTHKNARDMAATLREVGKLSDLQVLTNQQATREKIRQAITDWLPSVSRPGDTVLIYFTGHGLQVPDDNGDEADGLDEALVPHDVAPYAVVKPLMDRIERGDVEGINVTVEQYEFWKRLRDEAQQRRVSLDLAFLHATTITDDAFARWLRKLDGRQILVVLDCCHSGGMIAGEKSFFPPAAPRRFEFLKSELARLTTLKDIDQPNTFVLAACGATQTTFEIPQIEQSLMTSILLDSLRRARGPLSIQDAYGICRAQMREVLEAIPAEHRDTVWHEPVFYPADGGTPAYLKP